MVPGKSHSAEQPHETRSLSAGTPWRDRATPTAVSGIIALRWPSGPFRSSAARPGPHGALVAALSMAVFFNSLGALALGPLVPTIASELHTTVALVGQASALMMLMAGAWHRAR